MSCDIQFLRDLSIAPEAFETIRQQRWSARLAEPGIIQTFNPAATLDLGVASVKPNGAELDGLERRREP